MHSSKFSNLKVFYEKLTRISWNPSIHMMSEAVRSSMNISGLNIAFRSLAFLRTREFQLHATVYCIIILILHNNHVHSEFRGRIGSVTFIWVEEFYCLKYLPQVQRIKIPIPANFQCKSVSQESMRHMNRIWKSICGQKEKHSYGINAENLAHVSIHHDF